MFGMHTVQVCDRCLGETESFQVCAVTLQHWLGNCIWDSPA